MLNKKPVPAVTHPNSHDRVHGNNGKPTTLTIDGQDFDGQSSAKVNEHLKPGVTWNPVAKPVSVNGNGTKLTQDFNITGLPKPLTGLAWLWQAILALFGLQGSYGTTGEIDITVTNSDNPTVTQPQQPAVPCDYD